MLAQHVPQLSVDTPFQPVVRGRKGSERCDEVGVGEGEQVSLPYEVVQPISGGHQPGMGPVPASAVLVVGPLRQEFLRLGPPGAVGRYPLGCGICVLDVEEPVGNREQCLALGKVRPGRRLLFNLVEGVEDAALHAGTGPDGPARLLEAASSVGHHHLRLGYGGHERRPRPRVLRTGQVPPKDMFLAAGDQDMDTPGDADPVDEHDSVHLACGQRQRPYIPELRALAAEGPRTPAHVCLRSRGKEPSEEGCQQLCGVIYLVR